MEIKLHVITTICVQSGSLRRVGELRHEAIEFTGKEPPVDPWTKSRDQHFGLWREVMRTELVIDAPEMEPKELVKMQIESLHVEKSELEANFYVARRRIEDRIEKLQAIEHKA